VKWILTFSVVVIARLSLLVFPQNGHFSRLFARDLCGGEACGIFVNDLYYRTTVRRRTEYDYNTPGEYFAVR